MWSHYCHIGLQVEIGSSSKLGYDSWVLVSKCYKDFMHLILESKLYTGFCAFPSDSVCWVSRPLRLQLAHRVRYVYVCWYFTEEPQIMNLDQWKQWAIVLSSIQFDFNIDYHLKDHTGWVPKVDLGSTHTYQLILVLNIKIIQPLCIIIYFSSTF